MTTLFPPEGRLLHTEENQALCATKAGLIRAMEGRRVLEGKAVLCDAEHNLAVTLGPFTGYIPREEAALGIAVFHRQCHQSDVVIWQKYFRWSYQGRLINKGNVFFV